MGIPSGPQKGKYSLEISTATAESLYFSLEIAMRLEEERGRPAARLAGLRCLE